MTVAGVQAAKISGSLDDRPSAKTRSVIKYRKKPKNKPVKTHLRFPLVRPIRREKVAAINTIAHKSSGDAKSECQCNLCLTALKPASSSKVMNLGKAQNDKVVGDAKLS